jgi:hypothetical protein
MRSAPLYFKPSLRVTRDAEGPHMIGRERSTEIRLAGFSCTVRANSERSVYGP